MSQVNNVLTCTNISCTLLSLQVAYMQRDATHEYVRKALALPYLPEEHIIPAFEKLQKKTTDPVLLQLMSYINSTWIRSTVWPPSCWTVYMSPIRTNNDVEGWHRRLNTKAARGQLQLYVLIPLLYAEAELLPLQIKLVGEKKLTRFRRRNYRTAQGRLFKLWDDYAASGKTKNVSKMLKACSSFSSV